MSQNKPKQSLAISYDMQKRNKRKKMKDGGEVKELSFLDRAMGKKQLPADKNSPDYHARELPPAEASAFSNVFRPSKDKPKYAKGGYVNDQAKSEQIPMPEELDQDRKMVGRNSGKKALKDSHVSSDITIRQAQKPSITKLSQPKIVGSDAFSVRNRDQHEENQDQINSFYPESDRAQPKQRYDEYGAKRQGSDVSDMENQHGNGKEAYQMAVEDQYSEDVANDNMKKVQSPLGRFAEGGMALEMMDQPEEEAQMEHEDSIAAAIMAKKDRMKKILDSGSVDEDSAVKFYEGGQVEGSDESMVDIMSNGAEHPNAYYNRNENEVLKENYDNMEGVSQPMDSNQKDDPREEDESDRHDMIGQIRSKMNKQRQFKVR